ncbi:MAG: hypothetical protein AB9Q22_06400 [Candidatus Reddybacter sp.]
MRVVCRKWLSYLAGPTSRVVLSVVEKTSFKVVSKLALAASCTLTVVAFGQDDFAAFDRSMATFDPGGKYLTKPVERTLPGLSLNGTITHWSDYLVHDDEDIGFRDRDYRGLQMQTLVEIAASYRFSPNLELTSINHLMYDAVYDVDGGDGLYAKRVDESYYKYNTFDRIARELYVSYRTSKLDVVLGKQQIAWGKMDGQFIDVINSMDFRESVQLDAADYEVRRLPMWMANLTYYFDDVSLNVLWIPDFEANVNPAYGSPWKSPLVPPGDQSARNNDALLNNRSNAAGDRVLQTQRPDWTHPSDHQIAARLDIASGALTWGLVYYYAWERDASPFVTGRFTDASGDHLIITPEHERLHHFGATSDYAWVAKGVPMIGTLPIVFRAEALYTKDANFVDYRNLTAVRAGGSGNGISEHDTLRAALAFEFAFPSKVSVIFQPSFYYTFDWHEGLGVGYGGAIGDEWNFAPVFFISRPVQRTRDRLMLSATITPYLSGSNKDYQGTKIKLMANYEISPFINGSVIYTDYSGGDDDDLFGQFQQYDNIGVELQYEF